MSELATTPTNLTLDHSLQTETVKQHLTPIGDFSPWGVTSGADFQDSCMRQDRLYYAGASGKTSVPRSKAPTDLNQTAISSTVTTRGCHLSRRVFQQNRPSPHTKPASVLNDSKFKRVKLLTPATDKRTTQITLLTKLVLHQLPKRCRASKGAQPGMLMLALCFTNTYYTHDQSSNTYSLRRSHGNLLLDFPFTSESTLNLQGHRAMRSTTLR